MTCHLSHLFISSHLPNTDTFGTENEELKRKIRASEIDNIESKHLSKKAKGKRSVVQISDDDDKDEDVDRFQIECN
ncbi:unnamed protein product [Rhizophagus irregularis]|nr:unnamed protein product [Rhizophagus irregularis]